MGFIFWVTFKIFSNEILLFIAAMIAINKFLIWTFPINLVEKDKKLLFSINDNGKGFDTLKMSHKDGLGINQIDARIHMMSGKFIIDSHKGKGTKISVELPVFRTETLSFS